MHSFRTIKMAFYWMLYLPITGVSYFVAWLDRTLKFPLPFPRDIAQLAQQQDWCIAELKENGVLSTGAVVNQYKVTPLDQTFIFRSNAGIIEIVYTNATGEHTLKCFAKFAPNVGTVWNRTIFNLQLNHIKEIFFNKYFVQADKGFPAPEVYVAKMSLLTGNLCLITEFMNDSIEHKDAIYKDFTAAHLQMVLAGLANLHARYWKDTSARMKRVLPIENDTVYFFESMVLFSWSSAARQILVNSWCRMNEHQTVLHGDTRIGNMMFPAAEGRGRFVFIDWQAVRKGKAAYDLAYFLLLSLTEENRKLSEMQSVKTYHACLVANGVKDYSLEDLHEDYNHACLAVLLLLSLPFLSGEASAEGDGAKIFAWGMGVWRERMQSKFAAFDYNWLAKNYNLTQQQGKDAIAEMLNVIDVRLKRIAAQN